MKDRKKLQDNELKTVNGGCCTNDVIIKCPKCESVDIDAEHRGSGCDLESWGHCNKCGYEWKIQ